MSERWSTAEVVLAGPEFRWSLGLQQYEFPGEGTGYDGNWITAEVELVIESVGRFRALKGVSVLTNELDQFADLAHELLRSDFGEAVFEFTEGETGFSVKATPVGEGGYEVEIFVQSHSSPELRARELTTTRRHLREFASSLREAQRAFPVRGNPTD